MKKRNATRNALITSVIAIMLCVSMLVGTTFAWFTDEVTSSGNKIEAGTLQIDMLVRDANGGYTSIKDSEDPIFDYDLWEPGYTEVANVKVVNNGSLALQYAMQIVAEESMLADVIDVYYAASEVVLADRAAFNAAVADGTLTYQGSLSDIIAAGTFIADTMLAGEEDFATVVLHMQETANNDYQALSVGTKFDLKLFATQFTSESDSFNNQYDADAAYPVSDAAELEEALEKGGIIVLANDVTTGAAVDVPSGVSAVLDLNGNTLTVDNNEAKASCAVNNKGDLTITGGTITYEGVGDLAYGYGTNTINNTGKLVIDGATIINTTDSGSSVAIDCSAGAELIVNSGVISSMKNAIRLCPFGNAAINCTINGGEIKGARAIQIQLPSSDPASAPEINLTINDGTLSVLDPVDGLALYSYSDGQSFEKVSVAINGGVFNGNVAFGGGNPTTKETVSVTGGTFTGYLGRYLAGDGWEDIAKP